VRLPGRESLFDTPKIEGWREQTSNTFNVRRFPGPHFYLQEESRDSLLNAIQADLATHTGTHLARH
jgi:surfactin synthase thioesterase subunit